MNAFRNKRLGATEIHDKIEQRCGHNQPASAGTPPAHYLDAIQFLLHRPIVGSDGGLCFQQADLHEQPGKIVDPPLAGDLAVLQLV